MLAETLLQKGVSSAIDVQYRSSLLHFAAKAGIKNVLRRILDQPKITDVDIRDRGQNTPLLLAAESSDVESFQLLLDRGASIHATSPRGNVIHFAITAVSDNIRNLLLTFNLD